MTYTAEQIEAIGGKRWSKRDNTLRVYLDEKIWAPLVGLEVDHYKSGNISYAQLNGQKISNRKAGMLLGIKVYWQDGLIYIVNGAELDREIRAAIAQAVAATTTN